MQKEYFQFFLICYISQKAWFDPKFNLPYMEKSLAAMFY